MLRRKTLELMKKRNKWKSKSKTPEMKVYRHEIENSAKDS
jgi:hypothetical protein